MNGTNPSADPMDAKVALKDEWLTLTHAARYIGVSRRTIYNWIAAGKVETRTTASGTKRVLKSSLWKAGPM